MKWDEDDEEAMDDGGRMIVGATPAKALRLFCSIMV